MAALTSRQAARQRLLAVFQAAVDRVIPADEGRSLKGRTFREWEDQADEFDRTVTAALLQERAGLEENAWVQDGGRCPYCGSLRVYLRKEPMQQEVRTPHGVVVFPRQKARCRACDRTFSPSGPGVGAVDAGAAVPPGLRASESGGGGANL